MKGEVLNYDKQKDSGFIRGDDGVRYSFKQSSWGNDDHDIKSGKIVDFVVRNQEATEIFVITSESDESVENIRKIARETVERLDSKFSSLDKLKLLSALPYFLLLALIVWSQLLGNYDLYFKGLRVSYILFIPFIALILINFSNKNEFIKKHTRKSLRIFVWYSVFIIGIMSIYTLQPSLANLERMGFDLFSLGDLYDAFSDQNTQKGLTILKIPFWVIMLFAVISTIRGARKAFDFKFPKKKDGIYSVTES